MYIVNSKREQSLGSHDFITSKSKLATVSALDRLPQMLIFVKSPLLLLKFGYISHIAEWYNMRTVGQTASPEPPIPAIFDFASL